MPTGAGRRDADRKTPTLTGHRRSSVEIKRTIPKGAAEPKDFKTKKIFVGGIPTSVTEDEFKSFFSEYGKVVEHEIIRDHATKRSRGFGFVAFDNDQTVDNILVNGNMIDMLGTKVEIKKAEPKKPSNPALAPAYGSESRGRGYSESFGGFDSSYRGLGSGGFGPASYRTPGAIGGGRLGEYGGGLTTQDKSSVPTTADSILAPETQGETEGTNTQGETQGATPDSVTICLMGLDL